jgi:predicted acyl esterase
MDRIGKISAQLGVQQTPPSHSRPARAVATAGDVQHGGSNEQEIRVPMRDGVRLAGSLCLPAAGGSPCPVLLTMRYARDGRDAASRELRAYLAHAGPFAVAYVIFRGCHQSEGAADGGIYTTLAQDSHDTCEWLAAQPWCSGQVGSFGGSQAGFAQNLLASTAPPSLVAQYQTDTGLSLFHEAYRSGGGGQRGPQAFGSVPSGGHRGLPGHEGGETMSAWSQHPHYDAYWKQQDATPSLGRHHTPCCTVGSWFDFMCQGSIATYVGKQRLGASGSRGHQQLICGPWLHGGCAAATGPGPVQVGDLALPSQAAFPYPGGMNAHMAAFFRHHMKLPGALPREQLFPDAPCQYYCMGAVGEPAAPGNEWRTSPDWPLPATLTPYYLCGGGSLTTASDDGAPAHQMISVGSTALLADPENRADNGTGSVAFPGARDARVFESQGDDRVQTFTTSYLPEPVEWTGAVHAVMQLRLGSARDCDLIVRVSDVYPDGSSILIADYHRRASFRGSLNDPPRPLEAGQRCEVAFRVGWMSQIFNVGHRIRITVSCTGLPLYETGGNGSDAAAGRTVHQLLHGGEHASLVVAPVMGSAPRVDVSEDFVAALRAGVFPA